MEKLCWCSLGSCMCMCVYMHAPLCVEELCVMFHVDTLCDLE